MFVLNASNWKCLEFAAKLYDIKMSQFFVNFILIYCFTFKQLQARVLEGYYFLYSPRAPVNPLKGIDADFKSPCNMLTFVFRSSSFGGRYA